MPVVDLHCDLLFYLALNPDRTPNDPVSHCSFPQLHAGNVQLQVLAIYGETGLYSLLSGLKQIEIFQALEKHPSIQLLPAFESASAFCLENEPLDFVFKRLKQILTQITPLYISLTWNGENRFGGGIGSKAGLKKDGEELLRFLSGKGIAIDLSHATDQLSRETIDFIDNHKLELRIMASHCNFRKVENHPRNLPDDVAKEIIKREGLIGLVLYSKFLKNQQQLLEQIEYGLQLGGDNALAFGADFFCLEDFDDPSKAGHFFPEMADSSKYPSILNKLKQLSLKQLEAISSKNALRFINKI